MTKKQEMQDGVTQTMMTNGIRQTPWTMEHFVKTVAVTKTLTAMIITATQMEMDAHIVANVGTIVEDIGAQDANKTTGMRTTANAK